ncbi:MAG: SDR family oxidoreductase [Spirochaetaceae bacterium]|nr:MAG: SDR family oxidoreductase [Spirochaetaceae bacterium]
MFDKELLRRKVALVIGGSSESGPTVCSTLSAYGADIAVTYKSNRRGAERTAEGAHANGSRTAIFQFDLGKTESFADLVDKTVDSLGGLDILVNLGGPPPVYTDLRSIEKADFDLMMDTHFKGCFFLAREAANWMEKHEGGLIVNISATSSMKYSHSAYGLAKACVNDMSRFLAFAYAPKVRVLSIIPGMIDIEEVTAELRETRAEASPLKRIVTPEEIGLLVVAAASPAFRSVTGETLISDGGFWLLHP